MAPRNGSDGSDRDKDHENDNQQSEQNPFVHFRRTVDNLAAAAFSDLAEIFPSLQKHIPPPGTSFFDEMTREAFKRFNDSYERGMNPERRRIERYSYEDNGNGSSQQQQPQQNRWCRWHEARERRRERSEESTRESPTEVKPSPEEAAIFGMLAPFDKLIFGNDLPLKTWKPSTRYLTESAYSPCNLEQQLPAQQQGHWRAAFEDLLRIEHGQPMKSEDRRGTSNQLATPSMWIKFLAQRGVVEDQGTYPFLLQTFGLTGKSFWQVTQAQWRNPRLQSDFVAAQQLFWDLPDDFSQTDVSAVQEKARHIASSDPKHANTELDLYERWLRDAEEFTSPLESLRVHFNLPEKDEDGDNQDQGTFISSSDRFSSQSYASSKTTGSHSVEGEDYGSGVTQSTTTTERRVLPDGSILTHTTLTKKFANGREETDESTTVKKPRDPDSRPQATSEARPVETFNQTPRDRGSKPQSRIAEAAREQQKQQKQRQTQKQQDKQQMKEEKKKKEEEKSGWFWK